MGTDSSAVTVMVGETECVVTNVSDTSLTCNIGATPAGSYGIKARIGGKGKHLCTRTRETQTSFSLKLEM